jgi:hypothetical protein
MARRGGEGGQSTVEWVGLVLLMSLAALWALALAPGRVPGGGLANAIAARLVCAAGISRSCSVDGPLVAAYGAELAAQVETRAPKIVYEPGMGELPVDFRSCRGGPCAEGSTAGPVRASDTGQPAVAFVHVVDCRNPRARQRGADHGYDCSGARAGSAYLQYWFYYGDSATEPWSGLPGHPGAHPDDWEGYQLRVGPSGADARATSHHGYAYGTGPRNWPSDLGLVSRSAWGEGTGRLYVSAGSHAGHVYEPSRPPSVGGRAFSRAAAAPAGPTRWTPAADLALIPVESLAPADRRAPFAIAPPWRKPVYLDPEDTGT